MRRPIPRWILLAAVAAVAVWWLAPDDAGTPDDALDRRGAPTPGVGRAEDDVSLAGRGEDATEDPGAPADTGEERYAPTTWYAYGRVVEPDGTPIEGAVVAARLSRGDVDDLLGTTTTDEDGAYLLNLPALDALPPLLRAAGSLLVEARATGCQPGPDDDGGVWIPDHPDGGGFEVNLILERGPVVRGRVLDPAGNALAGMRVGVTALGVHQPTWGFTDGSGSYVAPLDAAGPHTVACTVTGVGTGRLEIVADGTSDVLAPDLVLGGDGFLAGRAEFPDGTPAEDVVIRAEPVRFAPGSTTDNGTRRGTARTDTDGRFRVEGLRPGVWHLRYPADTPVDETFETGETEAIVVVRRHRVRLRVADEAGRPVPGASYWLRVQHGGTWDVDTGRVHRTDGVRDLWAVAGERLLVSVRVAGAVPAEADVLVRPEVWDQEIRLVLRLWPVEPGFVRVRLTAPDGEPIPRFLAHVKTPVARAIVAGLFEETADETGLLPAIPAGTWRLVLLPGRAKGVVPLAPFFGIEEEITVRPGETLEVARTPRAGGRIRLRLSGAADEILTVEHLRVSVVSRRNGTASPLRAFVTLRDGGGWTLGALRRDVPGISRDLVEPGPYTLHVTGALYRPVARDVEVHAGRFTDVEVRLEAE